MGNAVLDVVLAPGFIETVAQRGLLLRQRLAELKDRHPKIIEDIRGEGLMMGIKTRVLNTQFVSAARDQHLLLIPAGDNVARLLPPLIITEDDISEAFQRLDAACTALEQAL